MSRSCGPSISPPSPPGSDALSAPTPWSGWPGGLLALASLVLITLPVLAEYGRIVARGVLGAGGPESAGTLTWVLFAAGVQGAGLVMWARGLTRVRKATA